MFKKGSGTEEKALSRRPLIKEEEVEQVFDHLVESIVKENPTGEDTVLIGIQSGGAAIAQPLAQRLAEKWGREVPLGYLDVAMHRDDIGQRPAPVVHPTHVPFDVEGKRVILVDDVLWSGRTTRAALDALTDLGRPRLVELAVLIDRGHRELPIQANYVGKFLEIASEERIEVVWDEATGQIQIYLIPNQNNVPQE